MRSHHFMRRFSLLAGLAVMSALQYASAAGTDKAKPPSSPKYGSYGFDNAGMDASVKPGDDFYSHMNGNWQKKVVIPEDRSNYGMFTALAEQSEKDTREIIETTAKTGGAPGSDAQKVADAYRAFMDTQTVEKRGLAPLKATLDSIAKIDNRDALVKEMGRLNREESVNSAVNISIGQDSKRPDRYWVEIGQGGLGLGDRDLYDLSKKQFDKQRAGYKVYLRKLFDLSGRDKATERADAVYALEEKIAAVQWTRLENRDPQKTYNARQLAAWKDEAPGVNWALWFDTLGVGKHLGSNEFGVAQPGALIKTAELIAKEPLDVWKDYLSVRALDEYAGYLPKKFEDAHFEFHGTVMSGTPKIQDRWKRAVEFTTGSVPDAVSKLYVAKYFPPETKARAEELVGNLLKAMGGRIKQLSWMSDTTKEKALQKLATYNPKIGYPRKWKDYSNLDIKADDLMGNARRAQNWVYNRQLAKLGTPIDRDEWYMTPMTVNAYYNPVLNEIVFPAAILQAPFFDANADNAINYGGIGAVIGHEITHGFDDQGRQFDASGALNDWWTAEDAARFNKAAEKLVEQYNKYCPFEGLCVNGKLTLGENIADIGGISVAYDAYQLSLNGKPSPVLEGVSGDQRFLQGFGQIWRRAVRESEAKKRLSTDPHSPDNLRVQTVRNFAPWYKAYEPKPEQKLYLKPDDRVTIW